MVIIRIVKHQIKTYFVVQKLLPIRLTMVQFYFLLKNKILEVWNQFYKGIHNFQLQRLNFLSIKIDEEDIKVLYCGVMPI